jgi:hypothetical protein
MLRKMVGLLVLAVVVGSLGSVAVGQEAATHSGTITVTATSAAVGIGWSWGAGTLTLLDGSEHKFKVSGLDVVAVGFKQATDVGHVFNLKKLEDFEGQYVKATAGAVVGGGIGATSMRNDKGVVINATASTYAAFLLDFSPANVVAEMAGFTRVSNAVKLPVANKTRRSSPMLKEGGDDAGHRVSKPRGDVPRLAVPAGGRGVTQRAGHSRVGDGAWHLGRA